MINPFGKENVEYLTERIQPILIENFDKLAKNTAIHIDDKKDYLIKETITDVVKFRNFDFEEHPENCNLYISDVSRKKAYLHDDEEFKLCDLGKAICSVIIKAIVFLEDKEETIDWDAREFKGNAREFFNNKLKDKKMVFNQLHDDPTCHTALRKFDKVMYADVIKFAHNMNKKIKKR